MDRDDYFCPDDDDGALAHQLELEGWQRLLEDDPAHALWLEQLELQHKLEKELTWPHSMISTSTP